MTILDRNELQKYISRYHLEKYFSKEHFPSYADNMELVCFHKGEYIYNGKNRVGEIYFFLTGKVIVRSILSNGKRQLIYYYDSFGILGDIEIFNISNPYTTIQAVTDSVCIGLLLANTQGLLLSDADFLRYLARELAEKVNSSSSNFTLNIYNTLESRLSAYILYRAVPLTIQGRERLVFHENLGETADLLGSSYRHLTRTLKALRDKEIIERIPEGYAVRDLEALRNIASDNFI